MAKCAKCSKLITKKSAGLQCGKCSKWYHANCVSLTTEQLTTLTAMESVDWKCKNCVGFLKQKRISVLLPDEEEENTDTEASVHPITKGSHQELRRLIRETIQEEMQRNLQFFSDKFDDFQSTINAYEDKIKTLDRQNKDLANKMTFMKNKADLLEQRISTMEQLQINNKLEVCGVTKNDGENLNELSQKICNKLEMDPNDVTKVYRKISKAPSGQIRNNSTIVITLKDEKRDLWLDSAKTKTITGRDIGSNEEGRIYLRESLTPATAYLLWRTKTDLKTSNLVKYVWCKRGCILIRKSDEDKIHTIRSEEDIKKWAQDLKTKD